MAKRPFTVSNDERAIAVTITDEEVEQEADKAIKRFIRKYGRKYPRLVNALKAKE